MTSEFSRQVLRVVVAQICQTIGWHAINSTPLEFMVDLMQEYFLRISKLSRDYAEICGRTEPNLDDLGVAFQELNIDLSEIAEYVKNVDPVPCVVGVPKLPIHRESHLNFLKPGSREVVTRPVHIHDYLPPMYPEKEEEYSTESKPTEPINNTSNYEPSNSSEEDSGENITVNTIEVLTEEIVNKEALQAAVFKRPGDPISNDGSVIKRPKISDNGRPLREIHSVIMTTSGLLSTAREGKLPEKTTPYQERVKSPTPPPEEPIILPPDNPVEKKVKKIPKKSGTLEDGKPENKENKKKKIPKDILFEPDKVKKLAGMKELAKLKVLKPASKIGNLNLAGPSSIADTGKIGDGIPKQVKNNTVTNKVKTEKNSDLVLNSGLINEIKEESIDKLPNEVDKQKLNILKKISSKSKEDKDKELLENSQLMSGAIGDEQYRTVEDFKQSDKKLNAPNHLLTNASRVSENAETNLMSPGSDEMYSYEMSPPRTPGTPKTPDINVPIEQKKRKREKSGKKKEPKIKTPKNNISKKARLSNDSVSSEIDVLDRPKTPQAPEQPISRDPNILSTPVNPFPNFSPFPSAPGHIPQLMYPPYIQKGLILPPMGPNSPMIRPNLPIPHLFRPPTKVDPVNRQPVVPPSFVNEPSFSTKQSLQTPHQTKSVSSNDPFDNDMMATLPIVNNVGAGELPSSSVSQTILSPAVVPAPLLPPNTCIGSEITISKPIKPEKMDKALKKLKEHKKDKKDKLKKKKEKKEKHRDKGEKIKEKKDKSEKKDKLEKIKEKKEKKEKRKEKEAIKKMTKEEKIIEGVPKITLKLGPAGGSPRPPTPDSALTKKITIKPPKKPDEDVKREPTPELARISALITRPPKQKTKTKAETDPKKEDKKEDKENGGNSLSSVSTVSYVDPSGHTVWICPSCGKLDDGSAMIGCDECDAWYHWVCVGIQVEPATNEDWYCRQCIAKKQEQYHDKKKKKRKKKNIT